MDTQGKFFRKLYIGLYYFAVVIVLIYVVAIAFQENGLVESSLRSFSEGWTTSQGDIVTLDGNTTGAKTVFKNLPDDIAAGEFLCFESNNANIEIFIENRLIYSFKSRQNFTGWGYGYAFHNVPLTPGDAGRQITIAYSSSVWGNDDERIIKPYIGQLLDYNHMIFAGMLLPCALSALILFFGIMLLFTQFAVGIDNLLPFSISSLAAISIVLGMWGIVDCNAIQFLTGRIYTARFLYMMLPFLVCYPIVCFVNSITNQRRLIYRHLAFFFSTVFLMLIPILRYGCSIDLSKVFFPMAAVEISILMILMIIILVDDNRYCKKHGKKMGIRNIIPGVVVLLTCSFVDIVRYGLGIWITDNVAVFTRFGLVIFIFILMGLFLRWWTKDQKDVERDRFINRALQYAVSSSSPDESIRAMADFLGKELEAKRLFIFEDQKNGKYRGTYEWYREGEESAGLELMYLPYEGLVDKLYYELVNNNHRLIIDKPEEYKYVIPQLYSLIMSNHIENMILAPLEVGGHIFGVCGVVNAPQKTLNMQAEIINLMSYFLAQLVLQREEQNRSYFYSYNDVLSGAGNYMSYRKFTESELDTSSSFGFLRCDLMRLDEINVTEGYEVGDQIVVLAARNLMEVFGEKAVFRMNGTQFTAFGFETDELFFNNDVERLKKLMKENGIEAAIASVYCIYGTRDIGLVTKRVDDMIKDILKDAGDSVPGAN